MRLGRRSDGDGAISIDCAWLIADTEAFLSGDYARHMRRHGQVVPTWARLNQLAHGELRSLRHARRPLSAGRSAAIADWTEEAWRSAQRVLARELLSFVGNDRDLWSAVQRTVLIPLELQLIAAEATGGVTALELVQCTRAALLKVGVLGASRSSSSGADRATRQSALPWPRSGRIEDRRGSRPSGRGPTRITSRTRRQEQGT